jgi:predicted DNA-binding transcriptional regulator YafY
MNLLKTQRYLEQLDKFLIEESTGTADCLADKMGIGVRTLFLHLEHLRHLGIEIHYDPSRKTYCYTSDVRIAFDLKRVEKSIEFGIRS